MDLPVWQALYESVAHTNFLPIAVALESRGSEAARPWIEGAKATYPCLVDETHLVAALYGMVNVPIAVWINEDGIIVRPPEPAGTNDSFRAMSRTDFSIPEENRKSLAAVRRGYVDALKDWAERGDASPYALAPDEVRRRLKPVSDSEALADTHFRLGEYLWMHGDRAVATRHLDEAKRLKPASWAFKRQAWNLEEPTKSGGPEFWAAVDATPPGEYYGPIRDIPPARV